MRTLAATLVAALLAASCGGLGDDPAAEGAPAPATAPSTAAPSTTAPSTTAPSTTAPSTTAPSTTAPSTTAPSTTGPSTTGPAPATAPAVQEPPPPATDHRASTPVAIVADRVDLAADVVPVGLAGDGSFDVPGFDVAGWYRHGGRPGGSGPTVIAGHVDSRAGPSVFFELRHLVEGDAVDVTLEDGSVARYVVTAIEQHPKAAFPTFDVFGATDADLLRLVTCTGTFDRSRRSYLDNLVVTAERSTGS